MIVAAAHNASATSRSRTAAKAFDPERPTVTPAAQKTAPAIARITETLGRARAGATETGLVIGRKDSSSLCDAPSGFPIVPPPA